MKYLLGIDFGGGASKATLIDTAGNIIADNTVEYPTLYPEANITFKNITNNKSKIIKKRYFFTTLTYNNFNIKL